MRAGLGSIAWAVALLVGCGGGDDGGGGGGGGGTCTPAMTRSVSISAAGLSPRNTCLRPGGTVTFTNTDTVAHDLNSSSAGCPELDLAPLAAGANTAVTLPTTAVCTYVDAAHASEAAFQGAIAVTTGVVGGPGY